MISERIIQSQSRKETEALLMSLLATMDLLIKYAEKRRGSYDTRQMKREAKEFWDEQITEY